MIDGKISGGFTSLSDACASVGVSYHSAARKKRMWAKNGEMITLHDVDVKKIKGRGKF